MEVFGKPPIISYLFMGNYVVDDIEGINITMFIMVMKILNPSFVFVIKSQLDSIYFKRNKYCINTNLVLKI